MPNQKRIDRRQFTEKLATTAGSLTVLLASSTKSTAADKPESNQPKKGTTAEDIPKSLPEPIAPLSQEVLLLTLLTRRYPSNHFDDAALKGILNDLRGDIARGRILSDFPLKNSDEPSSGFQAYCALD